MRMPCFLLLLVVLFSRPATAEVEPERVTGLQADGQEKVPEERIRILGERIIEFGPPTDLHARYLADPGSPRHALGWAFLDEEPIEGASDERVFVSLGGHYSLMRVRKPDTLDGALQLDFGGAITSTFDPHFRYDIIGWDGMYFITVSGRPSRDWSWRFGYAHLSAHLGDEYISRVGRERVDYLRDELLLGLAWEPVLGVRTYLEGGYGLVTEAPSQEPWRVQAGLEFLSPLILDDFAGVYLAVDVQWWEEKDWDATVTAQTGIAVPLREQGRMYRFGLQYYDGRSILRDFTEVEESFVMVGIWFDL